MQGLVVEGHDGLRYQALGFRVSAQGVTLRDGISVCGVLTLRVQVHTNHILTQNLYYNFDSPNPKYLILGYMDPLGKAAASNSSLPQALNPQNQG